MILLIHHPPDRPHHTDLTGALAAANEQATDQEEREGMETAPHDGFPSGAASVVCDSLFLFSMKFYKIFFQNLQL